MTYNWKQPNDKNLSRLIRDSEDSPENVKKLLENQKKINKYNNIRDKSETGSYLGFAALAGASLLMNSDVATQNNYTSVGSMILGIGGGLLLVASTIANRVAKDKLDRKMDDYHISTKDVNAYQKFLG